MGVYEQLVVERVKGFLKWSAHRFHVLDQPGAAAPPDLWGWKRVEEYWIKPRVWREQLCADDFDPQDVARALKGLDLLRTQDRENLQIVASVRGAPTRAYAVAEEILSQKPGVTGRNYGCYGSRAKLTLIPDDESPSVPAENPASELASPADLLQQGVVKGLRMAIGLLDLELDPSDRNYGTVLRAKTTLVNTLLNTQTRVDEARLRARHSESLLPQLIKTIKAEKLRLAALEPHRDRGGMGAGGERATIVLER